MSNLYSARSEEKRRQFNRLINSCNMVLMNNIPEVDESVWDNWQDKTPISEECDIDQIDDAKEGELQYKCNTHDTESDDPYNCDEYEGETEIYQWFAIGDSDAEWLKNHNQYITYSDLLDTYFLAITHFGTSWDYTSMVDDFNDAYHDLDKFDDDKEVV